MKAKISINENLIVGLIFLLINLKLLFSFSFHLKKLEFTSYLIDAILIFTVVVSYFQLKYNRNIIQLCILSTSFLVYVILTSIRYQNQIDAAVYYSRFWLPMVIYAAMLAGLKGNENRWLEKSSKFVFFTTALGFIGLFFMPENFNHNEIKLPTYFSGLHKSSYIFICNIMIAMSIYNYIKIKYKPLWFISVFFMIYMIFEGWEIRTPMLMLVIFLTYTIERNSDLIGKSTIWIAISSLGISLLFFGSDIDWNRVSSGRLAMWDLKISMIQSRSFMDLILGTGFGSDYVEVEGWFGEKDSHNNYIQTIIELGFLGLILLCLTLFYLFKMQSTTLGKAAVLSYIISGLVSNGLIYRLVPSYVFITLLITIESIGRIEREENVF